MIEFTVLGEPVAKGRPRISTRNGFAKAYTPEKTANYENLVRCAFQYSDNKPYEEGKALEMFICFCVKIPASVSKKKKELMNCGLIKPTKKPDIDNMIKSVCDALNGVAYKDDSQIVSINVKKVYDDNPRTKIVIHEIGEGIIHWGIEREKDDNR